MVPSTTAVIALSLRALIGPVKRFVNLWHSWYSRTLALLAPMVVPAQIADHNHKATLSSIALLLFGDANFTSSI